MKHIISTKDFTKKDIEQILSRGEEMEKAVIAGNVPQTLKDKIVACIFFEPSTRTRLSFETAALKLGAKVISAENAMENTSAYKGETIEDTSKILCSYADIVVMRHPTPFMPLKASRVATKPIINAGDGANEHPSQGFLDLYTIKKEHGRLTNLKIGFGGDLLNSRTLHSFMPLIRFFEGNTFYFMSPKELELPRDFIEELKKNNISFEEVRSLEEKIGELDVLYMTRVQKERFANVEDYNKVKDLFILTTEHMKNLKPNAIIMHPLPKINEIDPEIDNDKRAAYFRQAQNGLYARMALLESSLGI